MQALLFINKFIIVIFCFNFDFFSCVIFADFKLTVMQNPYTSIAGFMHPNILENVILDFFENQDYFHKIIKT